MTCFKPLRAWRRQGGGITFNKGDAWADRPLQLACRQCLGCRIETRRQWAIRCVHEQLMSKTSSYITLTYDDENLPELGSLNQRDFQLFAKRLRKKKSSATSCAENTDKTYGRTITRPCSMLTGLAI